MSFLRVPLGVIIALCVSATISSPKLCAADSVMSDPLGMMRLSIPSVTDALISAPLQRPAIFTGRVASREGARITVAGAPGWEDGALAYEQGVQPETWFFQIGSGAMRGSYFTIVGNDASSLTLDLNGETLDALAAGDSLTVRPYWTLGTLFGEGSGFPGSPTFTPVAEVQFVDTTGAGINRASAHSFFYYSGASFGGPGWRQAGSPAATKFDNTILYPDVPVRIRNFGGAIQLTQVGGAPMAGHRVPVGTIEADLPQDNFVALMSAADVTLGTSGLVSSGAVEGSPTFTPVDSVLVMDNAAAGLNKAAAAVYFYYTGPGFGGPGWRKAGSGPTTLRDTEVLSANAGFVIRKARSPTPKTAWWTLVPDYAQ